MAEKTLSLAAEFPAATVDDWRRLVDKVLKGGDFEKRLVSRTADGLAIQPLYTRSDALPDNRVGAPGAAPFTRGRRTGADAGWDIRQRVADPEPDRANAAILGDLEGGVTSITLQVAASGQYGLPAAGLETALAEVLLDICPVALEAGDAAAEASDALIAVWEKRGVAPAYRRGALGIDPIGTLARTGTAAVATAKASANAARFIDRLSASPDVTVFRADGRLYHAAGATDAQELAAALATFVAYLRASEAAGHAPEKAARRIEVALAADTDQFAVIAKLRAARRLVWRVLDAAGAGDAAADVPLTAETAERMLTKRDPWVNMLRSTMAVAAAALGGADAITVHPFTWALGRPDAFARRVARNTQLVLMEEAALGRVADPTGGSWYVERLTDDLANAAWTLFQEIERNGGIAASLAKRHVQGLVGAAADARTRQIASGRVELTGVSAFPRLGDDGITAAPHPRAATLSSPSVETVEALPLRRLAAPFEALRDRADCSAAGGKPPRVFLASLGTLADFNTRATWIRNYLAAGGIEAIATDGFTNSADVGAAFAASGARVACICSTDAIYGELGEATASVLKAAGAAHVCLAGRPKEQQAALSAAGVDTFIFAGGDAITTLTALHDVLGTPG
jgi:methylmalonyl-CoA mutase